MKEVIQDWLGTRLGVLLDLSPEKFSKNTKDGTLLAKLLYNFGVLPVQVLQKVKETKNYFECYNNLLVLKPWLSYIGVLHDDSTLQKMAGGEASAAVSIFYAAYLNLERKDRLHYLSTQKEKRFSENACRFKVDWVPETQISASPVDNALKSSLAEQEKNEMINYHKAKCKEVIDIIKNTKEKFEKGICRNQIKLSGYAPKCMSTHPPEKPLTEAEETKERICAFEKKHIQNLPNLSYSELIDLKKAQEAKPTVSLPNMAEAKQIVSNIKKRKHSEIYSRNFQVQMQQMVLDDTWKQIINNQDKNFENRVCANFLKQSQYEKQMASKLAQIRNQKKVLAENRKKIESLKIDQKVKEYEDLMALRMEFRGEYWEDEEIENERNAELHRRIYDERVKMRKMILKEECKKISEALVDIAIRIALTREFTACQVPKSLMKDMKELFFKDLSIFDILENFEELYVKDRLDIGADEEVDEEEEETVYQNDDYEQKKRQEKQRQDVLDECDLFDYLNLLGPWMVELLFPDSSETEAKHVVLGYIVHKLLAVKYPVPNIPVTVPIKPMKPTSVILGLYDDTACNMLIDIMKLCKILVVRVEDAINFVLAAYKEELSVVRDIDITFQKATESALKDKTTNGKENDIKKKLQLLKKDDSDRLSFFGEDFMTCDKQTQTPRMIPDDDPLLSPNAEIGKLAFEALGNGDPVPDPVIASALVAYVFSKQEYYDGWVLLNYPLLYSQASGLECTLTGYRILPVIQDMDSLEDVEGFAYRESCVDPFSKDDLADRRISRLVPKPDLCAAPAEPPKSYFDSFIIMKKISDSTRLKSQELISGGPMEKFYSDHDILFNIEYSNMNFQSIKNLGKAILGEITQFDENNSLLAPKNSVEIFGEQIMELSEKWDSSKKKNGKETVTKKLTKDSNDLQVELELVGEEFEESKMVEESKVVEVTPTQHKPGDCNWEWADGPQPQQIQEALASLWENMEAVYIEDFKDVFFALRVHRSNVLSYCSFIKRSMRTLMRKPDEKQKVLSDFHKMFNDIDEDLRPDVDIKCELHVRVSELQEALMEIADQRKANSLKDLGKVGQDGWVSDEMATLVNIFLTALQLEVDRCIDSCQVIMDYYISLQQKVPDEKPLAKLIVPKLQIQDRKYSIVSSLSNRSNSLSPINSEYKRSNKSLLEHSKSGHEKMSKTRSLTEKRKRSSDVSFLTGAAEVIMEILVNLCLPDDGLTPFHNFCIDNFHMVSYDLKDIVEGCISEAKKGSGPKNQKKISDTKITSNGNLNAEWIAALETELSRLLFRVKIILARGIFEMNEFLMTILNILSSLAEEINEMYLKETHSISECCKVFRCGIEEEIGIQPYLELKEDEFIVDESILLFPNKKEEVILPVDENLKLRFTIEQLSIICQKLQRVAPDGEIIKMSLLYILEDLRTLKPEVENSNCFPDIWNSIEPNDMTYIINEIYKDLEIVHWKDFIIYAMDLPVPTETDILEMRQSFRRFDCQVTELVIRENYDTVRFWFETTLDHYTEVDRNEKAKDLLYRMYQVDEHQCNYSALLLAFCKDKNPIYGFTKALALAMGKRVVISEFSEVYFPAEGEGGSGDYELFEEYSNTVKKLECCPTSSIEGSRKCIPKEKITTCDCQYYQKSSIKEEEEEEEMSLSERGGEDASLYFESKPSEPSSVVYAIPYHILSSLLKASFQSLPQLSILLDCKQTFQETLNSIYDSLESRDDGVEVHKLIHHNFINRLIQTTNKFKFINIKQILLNVVEFKNSMGLSPCHEKLNVNFCLN